MILTQSRLSKSAFTNDEHLSSYISEINRIPHLTCEEENFLLKDWQENNNRKSFDKLIKSHMRLVLRVASGFSGYGLPIRDLIQEGSIGLMKSIEKFDQSRGVRLGTCSAWWIRASICQYVLDNWSLISLPKTADSKKLFFNLSRQKAKLGEYQGGDLSDTHIEQISNNLKVDKKAIIDMNSRLYSPITSLDKPTGDEEDSSSVLDLLADKTPNPEEHFARYEEDALHRSYLATVIATLPEKEQTIIKRRYLGTEIETLDEIAQDFRVTRERIRQIEERALEKIKIKIKEIKRKHYNSFNPQISQWDKYEKIEKERNELIGVRDKLMNAISKKEKFHFNEPEIVFFDFDTKIVFINIVGMLKILSYLNVEAILLLLEGTIVVLCVIRMTPFRFGGQMNSKTKLSVWIFILMGETKIMLL